MAPGASTPPSAAGPPDAPVASPAVRAAGLTVVRGGREVLSALDFAVPRGRITGLLGPSGCGKSTLMRAVVGTQGRVGGTLDVLGHPAGSAALRSRIGYVTQAPSVYADLTARQNLEYFAAVLAPGRAAAGRRRADVTRAISDVDLTSHAEVLAGNLSGGPFAPGPAPSTPVAPPPAGRPAVPTGGQHVPRDRPGARMGTDDDAPEGQGS